MSPVAGAPPLAHAFAICVNPPHEPEYIAAAVVLVASVIKTVCAVAVATNEYHTSSLMPVALHVGAGFVDCVAPTVVPAVGVAQVAVDDGVGNGTAALHSSFAGGNGGAVMQKLNVPVLGLLPTHKRKVYVVEPASVTVLVPVPPLP